jgi:hypothetical protein
MARQPSLPPQIPFFVEPSERSRVALLKPADADFGDSRRLFFGKAHLHNPSLMMRR